MYFTHSTCFSIISGTHARQCPTDFTGGAHASHGFGRQRLTFAGLPMPAADFDRLQVLYRLANGIADLSLGGLEDRLTDRFHTLAIPGFRRVSDAP